MRPLYISPRGRGGVDFGIQNILRSVRRYGAPQAELLQLPEVYNFAPALIPRGLPAGWWRNFDVIQGRSRVAFALRAPGRPLVTTVHHLTTDPELQPYSSPAQRLFYRLVESRYDGWSIRAADAVVCVSRYTQRQVEQTYGRRDTVLVFDGIDTDVFVPTPGFARSDHGLPAWGERELPPHPAAVYWQQHTAQGLRSAAEDHGSAAGGVCAVLHRRFPGREGSPAAPAYDPDRLARPRRPGGGLPIV